jgi:hypothetical protein
MLLPTTYAARSLPGIHAAEIEPTTGTPSGIGEDSMTTSQTSARASRRADPPKAMKTASQLRDALPFFLKDDGTGSASWWHVSPTGSYSEDFATGLAYAKAFRSSLLYNAGPTSLVYIVEHMARAGSAGRKGKHLDGIAVGFLTGIGGALQSAMFAIGIGRAALDDPDGDMATDFRKLVDAGEVLNSRPAGLTTDPNALAINIGSKNAHKKRMSQPPVFSTAS